jgi:hypothetical protein
VTTAQLLSVWGLLQAPIVLLSLQQGNVFLRSWASWNATLVSGYLTLYAFYWIVRNWDQLGTL